MSESRIYWEPQEPKLFSRIRHQLLPGAEHFVKSVQKVCKVQVLPGSNRSLSFTERSQQTDCMNLSSASRSPFPSRSSTLLLGDRASTGLGLPFSFLLTIQRLGRLYVTSHVVPSTMVEAGSCLFGMRSGPIRALNWTEFPDSQEIVGPLSDGQRKGGQEANAEGLGCYTVE